MSGNVLTVLDLRNVPDEIVVEKILSTRNSKLFEVIYDRYADRIYNKCLSFSHDSTVAEDLTHEVLVKIYMKLATFNGKSSFSTWTFSITYNHCADFYKRQTRQREEKEALAVEFKELASSSDQELFEIKINRLSNLLNKLEPDERMILLMKYRDDVSIKELSRILELNDSAVKMRLSRARQKIIDLNKALFSENIY